MQRYNAFRIARLCGLSAVLFGATATTSPLLAQTIEQVNPGRVWTMDPVGSVYNEYPDSYSIGNCKTDLVKVFDNQCFVDLIPVQDNNGFTYKQMCIADAEPSECDNPAPSTTGVTAYPYLICPETYRAVTSGTVRLWNHGGAHPGRPNYVDEQNPGPLYIEERFDNADLVCQRCAAPFEWSQEEQKCVTYCPPDASILDLASGECRGAENKMAPPSCAVEALNPINTMTGEKIERFEPDYSGSGELPLHFARSYASLRSPQVKRKLYKKMQTPQWAKYIQPDGYLGPSNQKPGLPDEEKQGYRQWKHSYDWSIAATENNGLRVKLGDGTSRFFKLVNGVYEANNKIGDNLAVQGSGWLYTKANGIKYSFDSEGLLTRIENQSGIYQTLVYNAQKRLSTVTHANGSQLTLGYDDKGLLTSLITPDGDQISYAWEPANQNLASVTFPDDTPTDSADNPKENYHNDVLNHPYLMTGITDANGVRYKTWGYDENGYANSSSHAGGADAGSINFATDGTSAEVTHASGKKTKLTFANGQIMSIEGASCSTAGDIGVAHFSYDSAGRIVSKTDEAGVVTAYAYNSRGLRTQVTEASGTAKARTTTIEYHPVLAMPTKITTADSVTDITITDGKITQVTQSGGGISRTLTYQHYDSNHVNKGLLKQIDGPRTDVADVTAFTYDANGNLASVTNALGHTNTYSNYTVRGLVQTITDANGIVTNLVYDRAGRVISTTVGGGLTTSYQYDNVGQLSRITLPTGAYTQYEYTDARKLKAISDSLGNRIEYSYDAAGNTTKVDTKDPQGILSSSIQMAYDQMNRLASQTDGLGQTTSFAYDIVGRQINDKSPMLKQNAQAFDSLSRMIETQDAAGVKTSYGYDEDDNLVSVKDGNNAQTQYVYDGLGNMTSQSSPDTGVTTFTHDAAGNIISKTDARNIKVDYRYDALNRLIAVDYADNSLDVTLNYDQGSYGKGRLTEVIDSAGTTLFSYNNLGFKTGKTVTVGSQTFTTSYGYDNVGRLSQITYPSGRVLTLQYNSQSQVSAISQAFGGNTEQLLSAATYVPFGSAKQYTLGNGKTVTKSFNLNGMLTSIEVPGVYQSQLTYNADHNVIELQGTHPQTFNYDLVDRLSAATGDFGSEGYNYDVVGNRTNKTHNAQVESLTYKAQSNQLNGSFIHDASGNRIQDAIRSYQYGEDNRLHAVTNNQKGVKTDYLYNGFGQRVQKKNLFETVTYLYNDNGLLIAEADATGKIYKEYVYFDGQLLVMLVGE